MLIYSVGLDMDDLSPMLRTPVFSFLAQTKPDGDLIFKKIHVVGGAPDSFPPLRRVVTGIPRSGGVWSAKQLFSDRRTTSSVRGS